MKLGLARYHGYKGRLGVQAFFGIVAVIVAVFAGYTSDVFAAEDVKHADANQKAGETLAKVVIAPRNDYCANIAQPAAEARFAFQKKALEDLKAEIDRKITALEDRRQFILAFEEKQRKQEVVAQKMVVDIFAKMKPDIAAQQLEKVDFQTSVSILSQLNVRVASTILNEMQTDTAAAIASAMAEVRVPMGKQ